MKKIKTVSVLLMTLVMGLSIMLSGCSFGSVTESIDTTPATRIVQGEGRYEIYVMTKGADGQFHIRPVIVPVPKFIQPTQPEGGKK